MRLDGVGSSTTAIQQFIQALHRQFPIKDLGLLSYFLRIEVLHSPKGILLSQQKYISNLLEQTGMTDAKDCSTPIAVKPILNKIDGTLLEDGTQFWQTVSTLQYATMTRPDISFACFTDSDWSRCNDDR
ncbi:uncharacterized mitochondrial protein AtMg00810-like [Hevea brasiliensis]|uniref:uncharacterized mitochondrial protein AtMg00810-like n=1 Tax=Hevea brasiliensis TaxID=3981 RepID=UPI0025D1F9A6|nr:uncharacterized mitochondrial protein AtMg00810-like [Hevea brasiliensis]